MSPTVPVPTLFLYRWFCQDTELTYILILRNLHFLYLATSLGGQFTKKPCILP